MTNAREATNSAQDAGCRRLRTGWAAAVMFGVIFLTQSALAQTAATPPDKTTPDTKEAPSVPAGPVDVQPSTRDDDIRGRIENILKATGYYQNTEVRVKQGVVFLSGETKSEQLKAWAGETAGKVTDVVAVFNGLEATPPSPWDFSSTATGLRNLWIELLGSAPMFLFGVFTLLLAGLVARIGTQVLRWSMRKRVPVPLLREVLARFGGFLFLLVGVYVILQVAGLARLAFTVIGGTGLVGLAIGIAFRDITENFLSSIFLSIQRPFRTGDLLDVAGTLGYVERLTARNTVLMTLDGNIVQIPNATVYKSTLRNFSSNPNRREDFVIGIGYEALVPRAQEVALQVLKEHPAVLDDPEPWVLVDDFGPATVNLRVYFWLDGSQHSWLKVKSSVMRLVKRAFQQQGISIPDTAREVTFLNQLDVRWHRLPTTSKDNGANKVSRVLVETSHLPSAETNVIATDAEGGLQTEAFNIEQQALGAREAAEANLLDPANGQTEQQ